MQLDCRQQGESQTLHRMKDQDDSLRGRGVIRLGGVIYSMEGIKSPRVNIRNVKQDG